MRPGPLQFYPRPVKGMFNGMVENGGLDLGCHPVGMRACGSRLPVEEAIGAIGMAVASDLVELLTS